MDENNTNVNSNETEQPKKRESISPTPDKLKKKKNLVRRQILGIVVLAVLVILLGVAAVVVSYYVKLNIDTFTDSDGLVYYSRNPDDAGKIIIVDKKGNKLKTTEDDYFITELGTLLELDDSGKISIFARVDISGKEELGINNRVLIFKHTEKADIQSIEVHNEHGTYTFYRDTAGSFQIKGHEGTQYVQETFASLVVSCGYTLSMDRLDPKKVEEYGYEEYGLTTETRKDADGNEYEYTPAYYILTDKSGNTHKVFVGDAIVSGAGYYVRYEGRENAVYIVNSDIAKTVLQPIETLVTPLIVYPMTMNSYFDVQNFMLMKYNKDKAEAAEKTEDTADDEEVYDINIAFSYVDLTERENTEQSSIPYLMLKPEYKDYQINDISVDTCLQSFYNMSFLGVVKLGIDDESAEKYGLTNPEYVVSFDYDITMEDKSVQTMRQMVFISQKTDRDTYYVCSPYFDMIVEIEAYNLRFLGWGMKEWCEDSVFGINIQYCTNIKVEAPDYKAEFLFDNSASAAGKTDKLVVTVIENGAAPLVVDTALFRKFYATSLYASYEGYAELTEEQRQAYIDGGDANTSLKLTFTYNKVSTNTVETLCYRFYRYSGTHTYSTLNNVGEMFILNRVPEKIIADAHRVVIGEAIEATDKY